jgi:calcineurin-like phosphoesterase
MKLLFLGDIVGRAAREAVVRQVPMWRKQYGLDFVVVNGENAAGGLVSLRILPKGFLPPALT